MLSRKLILPVSQCRLRNTAIWYVEAEDLPRIIHEAFHIANTGRKGPVLIDIPKDVSAELKRCSNQLTEVNIRGYNPTVSAE